MTQNRPTTDKTHHHNQEAQARPFADCRCPETADILFALLRAGMWPERPVEPVLLTLSPESWAKVYDLAMMQTVAGIAYAGLQRLPDSALPPLDVLTRWVANVERIERSSAAMEHALSTLFDFFASAGLHPVLQKGHAIARFYPRPELRNCGDIDIFFPKAQRKAALKLVRDRGLELEYHPDNSWSFIWEGIVVEFHTELVGLAGPFVRRYMKVHNAEEGFIPGMVKCAPQALVVSPLTDILMEEVHIMRHAFGTGIGLRQLCDMAILLDAVHDRLDIERLRETESRAGIRRWSDMLLTLLTDRLGLPHESLPLPPGQNLRRMNYSVLLRIVEEGGNFGQYNPGRNTAMKSTFRRKIDTMRRFISNARFSFGLAPAEAFWTLVRLMGGQFK